MPTAKCGSVFFHHTLPVSQLKTCFLQHATVEHKTRSPGFGARCSAVHHIASCIHDRPFHSPVYSCRLTGLISFLLSCCQGWNGRKWPFSKWEKARAALIAFNVQGADRQFHSQRVSHCSASGCFSAEALPGGRQLQVFPARPVQNLPCSHGLDWPLSKWCRFKACCQPLLRAW